MIYAWRFASDDIKVGSVYQLEDDRIRDRKIQGDKYDPEKHNLCVTMYGLHASNRIIDALEFSAGTYLERVKLSGETQSTLSGIHAAETRETLWIHNIGWEIEYFTNQLAQQALDSFEIKKSHFPKIKLQAIIDAKKHYLDKLKDGVIDVAELDAARQEITIPVISKGIKEARINKLMRAIRCSGQYVQNTGGFACYFDDFVKRDVQEKILLDMVKDLPGFDRSLLRIT